MDFLKNFYQKKKMFWEKLLHIKLRKLEKIEYYRNQYYKLKNFRTFFI